MLKSDVLLPPLVAVRIALGQQLRLWFNQKLHHSKLCLYICPKLQDAWYYKYMSYTSQINWIVVTTIK